MVAYIECVINLVRRDRRRHDVDDLGNSTLLNQKAAPAILFRYRRYVVMAVNQRRYIVFPLIRYTTEDQEPTRMHPV